MEELKAGGILVISRIVEKDVLKGYLCVSTMGIVKAVPLDELKLLSKTATFLNAVYDEQYNTLEGLHGCSISTYPKITPRFVNETRYSLVILATVLDTTTGKLVGVVCYNNTGERNNITLKKLKSISSQYKVVNADIVADSNYGFLPIRKDGSNFPYVKMAIPPVVTKEGDSKLISHGKISELPYLNVLNVKNTLDITTKKKAEVHMLNAKINMGKISPYHAVIYSTIAKKEAQGMGTMGVTADTLYYDPVFAMSLTIPQLTFVLIHEMLHIVMQHAFRFIGKKNHDLWNIATDLYINSVICRDFGISFGSVNNPLIETPPMGIFIETIGESIDFRRDTPETIYKKLLQENPNYNQPNVQMQLGGSGGSSGDQQSQSSCDSGQSQAGDGDPLSSNTSGSSPNDTNNDSLGDLTDSQSTQQAQNGVKQVSVVYNGKKLTGAIQQDILSTSKGDEESVKAELRNKSKTAVQKAKTAVEIETKRNGQLPVNAKDAGVGSGLYKRHIDVGLSSAINWRVLLKNMVEEKKEKRYVYALPVRSLMSSGTTLPSKQPIKQQSEVKELKICVDVSGSVSEKELNYILSEINTIYKKYKVTGELIYWSTKVGNAGEFENLKDMLKIEPVTDGGTDVKSVFDYLSGKTAVNGKKEKTKLKNIKGVFIFTDGYFSENYAEYKEKFGNKVVWIITGRKGDRLLFNPPFGKVIGFEINM